MGKLDKLVNMISEGRMGFKMDEIMDGTHYFEPGCGPEGEYPMDFRVTWGPDNVKDWLNKKGNLVQPMEGLINVGGLCYDAPCHGTLELKYLTDHSIKYTLDFDVKGKGYQYVGEKVNIMPWNLPTSHTTCFGTVKESDSGKLVSRSVTYFCMCTALDFVSSFRFE